MDSLYAQRNVISVTRQNDSTDYAIGEVINSATARMLRLKGVTVDNGVPFYVLRAFILDSAVAAAPAQIQANFFSREFPIAADNAAFAPTMQQLAYFLGKISMADYSKFNATTVIFDDVFDPMLMIPEFDSKDVYVVLTALNAYDPTAYEDLVLVVDTANFLGWVT